MMYFSDTDAAANSQEPFASVINLLGRAAKDRPISVVAHSHGNKILTEVGRDRANQSAKPLFNRMIFVEPDVEAKYMTNKLSLLTSSTRGMTFYHSSNDRALRIGEMLFKGKRAGQVGPTVSEEVHQLCNIEVVDASRVAAGWTRHAPHVDAIEVVTDIRDVLNGVDPLKRGLSAAPGVARWNIP